MSLLVSLGERYDIDPREVHETLLATCFKSAKDISKAQMIAICAVANQYKLNPFTREIYAFPDKRGGFVPVLGVDGWSKIVNQADIMDGIDFTFCEDQVTIPGTDKTAPVWCECVFWKKGTTHPIIIREYFLEVFRNTDNWKQMPIRMLRHKTFIQTVRYAIGFSGIYDADEARDITKSNDVIPGEVVADKTTIQKVLNVAKKIEEKKNAEATFEDELTLEQEEVPFE